MRNYTSNDIEKFYEQYEKDITHICVAQTRFRAYQKNAKQIELMVEQIKKDFTHTMNVFCSLLYRGKSNKVRRNPHVYRPLAFVTIEGTTEINNKEKTIHLNISLGNLPKHLTTTHLEIFFRYAWVKKAHQVNNIFFEKTEDYPARAIKFVGYSLKEGQQNALKVWSENSIWDVTNCWIPHTALNAD